MKTRLLIISLFSAMTMQSMKVDDDGSSLFAAIESMNLKQVVESLKDVKSSDITNADGEDPYQCAVKLLKRLYFNDYQPLNERLQRVADALDDPDFVNKLLECIKQMYDCAQIMKMVKSK